MAYVYGHYTADTNKLFYIGKGTDKRAWETGDRNQHWHRTVKKHGYTVKILYDNLGEKEALAKEVELIAEVGLENLTNILPGGEGFTSDIVRRQWQDPETRQKMLDGLKKTFNDEEFRKRRSTQMKNIWESPDLRKKASEWMKGTSNGKGIRKPEKLQQMKATRTRQWQDEAYRTNNLSARKAYMDKGGKGPNAGRTRNPATGEYFLPNVPFPYTMQSPEGVIYTFESIRTFTKEHNIPRFQLVKVLKGLKSEYEGWRALP